MDNKIIIESLSMDLMRVALGYHRNSIKMADRFADEALRRIDEIDRLKVKSYFKNVLNRLYLILKNKDTDRIAEDTLMYSSICRNYSKHYC